MDYIVCNGARLGLRRQPGRGPAAVLLHGWCCDGRFFAPLAESFAQSGRMCLSLDLRGHGESAKPRQTYSIAAFADDVAALCRQLGLERPLLIGHSMGGIVAYDAVRRYPDLASGLVMLDSAIVLPAAARAAMPAFLERLRGDGFADAVRTYVRNSLMLPGDDPVRCAWILDVMAGAPRHVAISAFEGLGTFDPGKPGGIAVPALYIAADEPAARTDLASLQQLMPTLQLGRTVGSGHFCQLEVPDQVNAMIARFLAQSSL